jgi:hypothetical protein
MGLQKNKYYLFSYVDSLPDNYLEITAQKPLLINGLADKLVSTAAIALQPNNGVFSWVRA